jgi:hypothetical protein
MISEVKITIENELFISPFVLQKNIVTWKETLA